MGFGNLDYNSLQQQTKENDNTASDDSKIWNKLPTVAAEVKTNGTTLMVCDWTAVKDSIHLPLSYFIEDLDIVKLDNKDEALVRNSSVTVSDNYILIHCSQNIPLNYSTVKGSSCVTSAQWETVPENTLR